jgi:hypothetical protein
MSELIQQTVADIRGGRDTWRVVFLFGVPSFILSIIVAIPHAF